MIRALALIAVALFGVVIACTTSGEVASDHLHSIGFHDVACENQGREALCTADKVQFRCVTNTAGCEHHVACERFYLEKPAP